MEENSDGSSRCHECLDPVYTIESQLREILTEHNFKGKIEDKVAESLQHVGLDLSIARRYPHELSGGQKQRVVIAMALLLILMF